MNELYETLLSLLRANASSPITLVNVIIGLLLAVFGFALMRGRGFKNSPHGKKIGIGCMLVGLLAVFIGGAQMLLF